ncbi:cell envelope integrity protein TolA [uncultured Desulfovibrio sp.]|uniref:cell envelope integrity protein TolA n=1 Tax=uncultured Desulfovibrio sp. TaxID=167968 RepID=UPI00260B6D0F|nr:cell envelope integrity protein TolA [uncultured Desulfovibrio sp.]
MNWASYLLSLCLHLAVFLLIMFWPSSPPVNLETPPVMISLVDGAPGGNRTPSSILGKMGKQTDGPKDVSPPAKKAEVAAPERPEVKADPTREARPVEAKPEPKVERKPEPKPEVRPKPEPRDDATPVADKKDKKKKEDKKQDDKKPEKKDDKKKPEKKVEKSDKKTDKKADKPTSGDPVAAAMKQARREATSRAESGDRGNSVEQALAQARRKAGGDGGGGGGEGDGPGGGGINDVYMGQVMLAVRPNWSFTSATRLNLVCVVRVKVNLQGEVEKVDVTQSSGNAQYDSSAANAIWRTSRAGAFPPPPSAQYTDLDLVFTLNELMGR